MKIDFHVHTKQSHDSFQTYETIFKEIDKKGLDGILLVDHNYSDSKLLRKEIERYYGKSNKNRPLIFRGGEFSTEQGHIILAECKERMETHLNRKKVFKTKELFDFAELYDAPVIWAHPFRVRGLIPDENLLKKSDAIEVYNSRSHFLFNNKYANEKAYKFAKKHKLNMTGGSDAHVKYEIANAFVSFDITKNDFLKEISCDIDDIDALNLALKDLLKKKSVVYGRPSNPMYIKYNYIYSNICKKNVKNMAKGFLKSPYAAYRYLSGLKDIYGPFNEFK